MLRELYHRSPTDFQPVQVHTEHHRCGIRSTLPLQPWRVLIPTAAVRRPRHGCFTILFALVLLSGLLLGLVLGLLPGFLPAAAQADAAAGAQSWAWPVGVPHAVIRPFVAPASVYAAGHRGIDISSAAAAPVFAPDDGVVFFVGTVVDRPVLSITHAGGLVSSFEPVLSKLPVGSVVHRGEQVGVLGVGGHCAAACLHFGVRVHGEYVSPLNYLGGIPRSVLLPTRLIVGR